MSQGSVKWCIRNWKKLKHCRWNCWTHGRLQEFLTLTMNLNSRPDFNHLCLLVSIDSIIFFTTELLVCETYQPEDFLGKVTCIMSRLFYNGKLYLYPPPIMANCIYTPPPPPQYCFHVVCPSVMFCFPNILKSHCWNFIKLCKHVHVYKKNTFNKKVRARRQFY